MYVLYVTEQGGKLYQTEDRELVESVNVVFTKNRL